MWHEARKQERKIRGIMVNYKKRAERRRAFYEKMKADPTTFLRIQGTNYKIHIDHQNTLSDDHINMMPWQGDRSVMIDRFDVRAHLDYIPPTSSISSSSLTLNSSDEEQKFNYERYRTLVMIEASAVSEEAYLKQLDQEEQNPKAGLELANMEKKEKLAPKASIGYTYQNSTIVMGDNESAESSEDDSDSDLDIDVAVNIDELETEQKNELNQFSLKFNIVPGKYCSMLKADKDEAELVQKVKDEEEARGQLRGRRAKRDRRSLKDQQRKFRSNSPLSYMRRESPSYEPYQGGSRSRSSSSLSSGGEPSKVEYITEFGAAMDATSSLQSGDTNSRKKSSSRSESVKKHRSRKDPKRSRSRSRSHDHERSRSSDHERSRSSRYTRSRSDERHAHRSQDHSSHKHDRTKSRSRSRSRSRRRHRSNSYNKSKSRSCSRENYSRYSKDTSSRRRNPKDDDRNKGKRSLEGISKALGATKNRTTVSADKSKLTPQEKLKKRMQLALNKQLKIDKKEERKKKEFKEQEKQTRDDDLREISQKWKEQKIYRHSRSRSRSPSPAGWTNKNARQRSYSPDDRRHARSHSRSPSPLEGVPLSPVDMDSHIEGEDVVHYVYET